MLLSLTNTPVLADRLPDEIIDMTNSPVPINRTATITGFFPYGRVTNELDVENAVGKITINGEGFEFVTTSFEDWYYGDPNRGDSDDIPEQPACNSSYTGPKYPITDSLASTTSIRYGLQSARHSNNPNYMGSSYAATLRNPDRDLETRKQGRVLTTDKTDLPPGFPNMDSIDLPPITFYTEGLRAGHTGCIKFEVKISADAKVGSIADIVFDQDFLNSPTYTSSSRPPKQVLRLKVGPSSPSQNSPLINEMLPADILSANFKSKTKTMVYQDSEWQQTSDDSQEWTNFNNILSLMNTDSLLGLKDREDLVEYVRRNNKTNLYVYEFQYRFDFPEEHKQWYSNHYREQTNLTGDYDGIYFTATYYYDNNQRDWYNPNLNSDSDGFSIHPILAGGRAYTNPT